MLYSNVKETNQDKSHKAQKRQQATNNFILFYFLWVTFAVLVGKLAPNSVSAVPWQCWAESSEDAPHA